MTLHTPAHRHHVIDHRVYQDLLSAIVVGLVVLVVVVLATQINVAWVPAQTAQAERAALQEFRAAERADWAAGVTTEGSSLLEFRASERASR